MLTRNIALIIIAGLTSLCMVRASDNTRLKDSIPSYLLPQYASILQDFQQKYAGLEGHYVARDSVKRGYGCCSDRFDLILKNKKFLTKHFSNQGDYRTFSHQIGAYSIFRDTLILDIQGILITNYQLHPPRSEDSIHIYLQIDTAFYEDYARATFQTFSYASFSRTPYVQATIHSNLKGNVPKLRRNSSQFRTLHFSFPRPDPSIYLIVQSPTNYDLLLTLFKGNKDIELTVKKYPFNHYKRARKLLLKKEEDWIFEQIKPLAMSQQPYIFTKVE